VIVHELYMCIPIDIVRWLSGGCTTSEPLPEGRPPPFACVYGYALSRFVEICPNVYPGFDMYKGGVDPPEVGRGRYNHLTTT